jgi:hypothetical protein
MTNWVAGWNMLGYSSDPDHLWITDSYYDAGDYLLDTLERWSDHDSVDEDYNHDDYLATVTQLESQRTNGDEIHVTYGDYHLWVTPTNEPMEED